MELVDVLRAASVDPAAVIGEAAAGRIAEGSRADLVLLDRNLEVVETICGGTTVWRR